MCRQVVLSVEIRKKCVKKRVLTDHQPGWMHIEDASCLLPSQGELPVLAELDNIQVLGQEIRWLVRIASGLIILILASMGLVYFLASQSLPDYDQTPGGGFFIFARRGKNIREAIPKDCIDAPNPAAPGGIARQDWALCQWMAEEKGVLCIPSAPFFSEAQVQAGASQEFVRVAFCKSDEVLEAAAETLGAVADSFDAAAKEDAIEPVFQEQEADNK